VRHNFYRGRKVRDRERPDLSAGERLFAIGGAWAGSTRRVASAVGQGAAIVAQIHVLLASDRVAERSSLTVA
jgi:thioredoxin reductase (NADPH)